MANGDNGSDTKPIQLQPTDKAVDAGGSEQHALTIASAYGDFNSITGPSAGASVKLRDATLTVATGGDAANGMQVGTNVGIIEASVKDKKITVGALPTNMGAEVVGASNNFNSYADINSALRTTAFGVKYNPNDYLSLGVTNDGNEGRALAPNALEASYTKPFNSHLNFYAGADVGLKKATYETNLAYTNGNLAASADFLHNNTQTIGSLETTLQIDKSVTVGARYQTTGKTAFSVRGNIGKEVFVQVQDENNHESVEAAWQKKV